MVGLEGAGKRTILKNKKLGLNDVTTSFLTPGESSLSVLRCPAILRTSAGRLGADLPFDLPSRLGSHNSHISPY